MPANYLMQVNGEEDIKVRLIGFVNEKECEAILNDEEAPKKVSTAENVEIDTVMDPPFNRRFVVVINDREVKLPGVSEGDIKNTAIPFLFISAVVHRLTYDTGNKVLECKDKNKYRFIPITN